MSDALGKRARRLRLAVADFVYEIACTGNRAHEQVVHAWAERHAVPAWLALPGLTAVDLYRPVRGGTHDPFNNDGPGPLLMAMLQFPTQEKLEAGLAAATGTPPTEPTFAANGANCRRVSSSSRRSSRI